MGSWICFRNQLLAKFEFYWISNLLKLFFFHFYYDLYSTHSDDSKALHDTKPTEDGDHHDHDEGDWWPGMKAMFDDVQNMMTILSCRVVHIFSL